MTGYCLKKMVDLRNKAGGFKST
ncbi:hypothetical protein EYZ11_010948 [Aspergillus tanneri]|uniref:Uncharacterized protein n=1 Tax=Aspergillus tanneri TaxID=1220188 RepID=A0A4S3J420_9EURO|nr:hypothetical protein EYZ11_010948 [Aspergillus tanneri]